MQQTLRCGRDAFDRPIELGGEFANECRGQVRDIVASIAQRRNVQLDHAQTEVQVAAKPPDGRLCPQVPVRRRHRVDIRSPRLE